MPASLKSQLGLGRQNLDLSNWFLEIFPLHRSIQVLLKKVLRLQCLHLEWQPGDTNQSRSPSACCGKGQSSTLLPRGKIKVSTEAHPQKRAEGGLLLAPRPGRASFWKFVPRERVRLLAGHRTCPASTRPSDMALLCLCLYYDLRPFGNFFLFGCSSPMAFVSRLRKGGPRVYRGTRAGELGPECYGGGSSDWWQVPRRRKLSGEKGRCSKT